MLANRPRPPTRANHFPGRWPGFGLFAVPGALILTIATRRRGGMGQPAASALALAARRSSSSRSRRHRASSAGGPRARRTRRPSETTVTRGRARAFREFADTSLGDPSSPTLAYVLLESHPTLAQRVAMADAWARRQDGAELRPLRPSGSRPRPARSRAPMSPGDGAFWTWSTPSAWWNTKSSSRSRPLKSAAPDPARAGQDVIDDELRQEPLRRGDEAARGDVALTFLADPNAGARAAGSRRSGRHP